MSQKVDITSIPRNWLTCRAWQHGWDHGPAPLQEDRSADPVVWVTNGRCECGTRRWRYFRVGDALPISEWDYSYPEDWRKGMRLVTQMQARAELARRDLAGERGDEKVDSIRKSRRSSRAATG